MYGDNLSAAQESHKLIHHISAERDRIMGGFHADTYSRNNLASTMNSKFKELLLIDYKYSEGDVMEKGRIEHILNICDTMIEQSGKIITIHFIDYDPP